MNELFLEDANYVYKNFFIFFSQIEIEEYILLK